MSILKILLLILLVYSCTDEIPEVLVPDWEGESYLDNSDPVPNDIRTLVNGVFTVGKGSANFGEKVVLKWNHTGLSAFTGKDATYMILQGGVRDSSILFSGYWRSATGSETGLVQFQIEKQNGGSDLLQRARPTALKIDGLWGNNDDNPGNQLILSLDHFFDNDSDHFRIIGHRGGGRNIDRLPYSENSVEMIRFAEQLGANAIEIDIQKTADGVPVLFHDEYMNKRLINEDYFNGKIQDYSYAQIRTFCTLVNGGKIPTLDEALNTVVEETNLELVWLDLKYKDVLPEVITLQKKYLEQAADAGRSLEILVGIPNEKILNAFKESTDFENIPSLCELHPEDVLSANSLVWAPRWSLGLQTAEVDKIHAQNKEVFIWTLDDKELIRSFLKKGQYDGIVTNYPTLVAYEHYILK